MRGQRMRQKIGSREGRTSSVFAPRPLAGAPCFREIGRMAWYAQVSLQGTGAGVKPARQYQPQGGVTVSLLAFWHPQPATASVGPQGTSRLACARQVRDQAGRGQAGLRWQMECTQRQSLRSARTASSVVVVPTPAGPMEFCKSTRDLKEQSAGKEHTNEVRDGGCDPGVRRPGAGPSQLPASS